jgi:general secretion pathway protein K
VRRETQHRHLTSLEPPHRKRSEGFILVAVLWMISALAGVAAVYSVYVRETASMMAGQDEELEAQELALSGVELAAYKLTAIPEAPPSRGNLVYRIGNAEVLVEFRAESARIDLNFAPKPVLAGLFVALGAAVDAADAYADRIVGWRSPLAAGVNDTEATLYRGRTYGPRHGPFEHVNELALLAGLPSAMIDCAAPYVTVYSGQAGIDVFDAAPVVLSALPGITPDRVKLLLSQREGASQDVLRAQLGMAAQYVTVQPSKTNRVTVAIRFKSNRRVFSEAVIMLTDKDNEPFRMLSWRHDIGDLGEISGLRAPACVARRAEGSLSMPAAVLAGEFARVPLLSSPS